MATKKISEADADASIGGSEQLPVNDAGTAKRVTTGQIKDYTIAEIEGITAGTEVDGDDKIYIYDETDDSLKPVDIDTVLQHIIDAIWAKADETAPADADTLVLNKGDTTPATERVVGLDDLANYIQTYIEDGSDAVLGSVYDVSDLTAATTPLNDADYILVTQGGTGKYIQYSDIISSIYSGLAAHVAGLSYLPGASLDDTDKLYIIDGSTGKYTTLLDIINHVESGLTLSGSGTADYLAEWSNANTLTTGPAIITGAGGGFTVGSDGAVPTTLAVLETLDDIVNEAVLTPNALADADTFLMFDDYLTVQRKSVMSRIWTYVQGKIAALTDISSWTAVVDEDDMSGNSDDVVCTQQSIKAYVDNNTWSAALDTGTAWTSDDVMLFKDAGGTVYRISGANLYEEIATLWKSEENLAGGATAYPEDDDAVVIHDDTDGALKRTTLTQFWNWIHRKRMRTKPWTTKFRLEWVAGQHGLPQVNADIDNGGIKATVIAGGAAGDHTVTGIATTDTLVAVLHFDMGGNNETDLTSEFSITGANTINNGGGTDTTNDTLLVLYIDSSANSAKLADPHFEISGANASSDDVIHYVGGGIRLQTDGADGDEVILGIHLDAISPWSNTSWGTEDETCWECWIRTGGGITNTIIWAGLKMTSSKVVATDPDQVFFRYEDDVDADWYAINSIGGVDDEHDTGETVAINTVYHLRIEIDSSRIAKFYINDTLVETTAALTNAVDLYPYIGIAADGAGGVKTLLVRGQAIEKAYPY